MCYVLIVLYYCYTTTSIIVLLNMMTSICFNILASITWMYLYSNSLLVYSEVQMCAAGIHVILAAKPMG